MKSILTITRNDLRIFFAQRSNLIGLVVLPLAFTLVLGWAFSGDGGSSGPARVRIDVLDQDGTDASAALLAELRAANNTLVLCPMDNDEADYCRLDDEALALESALERAQAEQTAALIVIPAGYADALANFDDAQIAFYAAGDPNLPNAIEQTVNAVLEKVNSASLTAAVTGALIDDLGAQTDFGPLLSTVREQFVQDVYADTQQRIATRPESVRFVTTTGAEVDSTADGFSQSVPGMGSMYVMFTVLAGMAVLIRERNQWTLQRLTALPITRAQILGGKVLTYVTLGMIQYLIVFGVGLLVGLDFGNQPLLLLPIMIAFVLCTTALAFAVAPWVTSEIQAHSVARLLSLSLAPLGGAWWPIDIVPGFMRTIGHLSPVAWAMDAFHDIMWYNGGLTEILPEVGVLLGAAVVLFTFGVRSFRYG